MECLTGLAKDFLENNYGTRRMHRIKNQFNVGKEYTDHLPWSKIFCVFYRYYLIWRIFHNFKIMTQFDRNYNTLITFEYLYFLISFDLLIILFYENTNWTRLLSTNWNESQSVISSPDRTKLYHSALHWTHPSVGLESNLPCPPHPNGRNSSVDFLVKCKVNPVHNN